MIRPAMIVASALALLGCDAKSVRVETDPTLTTYSRDGNYHLD